MWYIIVIFFASGVSTPYSYNSTSDCPKCVFASLNECRWAGKPGDGGQVADFINHPEQFGIPSEYSKPYAVEWYCAKRIHDLSETGVMITHLQNLETDK